MSTEPLTPRAIRQGITDKLAALPAGIDAHGHHDADRAADAAAVAHVTATEPGADPAPVQTGMKPNPAQGGGGIVPTPAPTDPAAAIRARLAQHAALHAL